MLYDKLSVAMPVDIGNRTDNMEYGRNLVGDRMDMSPPTFCSEGDRISDAPPPPPLGMKRNHVFQYFFAFYSHFYWTYPDNMFSLSTHIQIF